MKVSVSVDLLGFHRALTAPDTKASNSHLTSSSSASSLPPPVLVVLPVRLQSRQPEGTILIASPWQGPSAGGGRDGLCWWLSSQSQDEHRNGREPFVRLKNPCSFRSLSFLLCVLPLFPPLLLILLGPSTLALNPLFRDTFSFPAVVSLLTLLDAETFVCLLPPDSFSLDFFMLSFFTPVSFLSPLLLLSCSFPPRSRRHRITS